MLYLYTFIGELTEEGYRRKVARLESSYMVDTVRNLILISVMVDTVRNLVLLTSVETLKSLGMR